MEESGPELSLQERYWRSAIFTILSTERPFDAAVCLNTDSRDSDKTTVTLGIVMLPPSGVLVVNLSHCRPLQMSIGCDEAFARFASRADAAIVEPNNSVTALINAPSSRSAMFINLANVGPSLFVSSSTTLVCISSIAILDSRTQKLSPQRS